MSDSITQSNKPKTERNNFIYERREQGVPFTKLTFEVAKKFGDELNDRTIRAIYMREKLWRLS
ncbi:MAG: hypothetical protein NUV80_04255 [Candidatus Berkelbacteria bacterium]|nr:hypothetical protein [Candidatus Berkelbacteria bacterium]